MKYEITQYVRPTQIHDMLWRDAVLRLRDLTNRILNPEAFLHKAEWELAELFDEIPAHTIREIGFDYNWYRHPGETSLSRATDSEGRSMEHWHPKKILRDVEAAVQNANHMGKIYNLGQGDDGLWCCIIHSPYCTSYDHVGISPTKCPTMAVAVTLALLNLHITILKKKIIAAEQMNPQKV